MSGTPPEYGSGQPEQPQLDPSGHWQWDAHQQQWIPAQASVAPAPFAPDFGQQAPAFGQPYGGTPNFGPPQGYAPTPGSYDGSGGKPKSRKVLWIALAVVVIVVAGVVVGVVALTGKSSASPSATVTSYLDDLAAGNSSGAIAQGASAPVSTTFLSDDILKQQQAKAKISGIKIVSTDQSGSAAQVHVTYQFGARSADETFELIKTGGKWKLTQSTYPIDVSNLSNIPQTTLFGKPIANLSKVYVFPGPVAWGSGNKYFTVTDKNADKFALSPYDTENGFSELTADLSPTGKTAVETAITTYFQKCAQSKQLSPDGCPQEEFGDGDNSGDPVDGSVTWTAPTDFSNLQYQSGEDATKLDVQGTTVWQDTYQSKSFTDDSLSTITDSSNKTDDVGTVDLSQSPPVYTES
jgi:hypothetical protein